MYNHRERSLMSHVDMPGESRSLTLLKGGIPIEVHSCLPYRLHLAAVESPVDGFQLLFPVLLKFSGMKPYGKSSVSGKPRMKFLHPIHRIGIDSRKYHHLYSCLKSRDDGTGAAVVKLRHIDVGMGIRHFFLPVSLSTSWRNASFLSSERDVALTAAMALEEKCAMDLRQLSDMPIFS